MQAIVKTEIFICKTKANLDVKILLGNITHCSYAKIKKILLKSLYGKENSTFGSVP